MIADCSVCYELYHANSSSLKCAALSEATVLQLKTKSLIIYIFNSCTENGGESLVEVVTDLQTSIEIILMN